MPPRLRRLSNPVGDKAEEVEEAEEAEEEAVAAEEEEEEEAAAADLVGEAEGLKLHLNPRAASGYLGVHFVRDGRPKPFSAWDCRTHLGAFATAVEAAVCYARHVQQQQLLPEAMEEEAVEEAEEEAEEEAAAAAAAAEEEGEEAVAAVAEVEEEEEEPC